jgi:hypothetical protein
MPAIEVAGISGTASNHWDGRPISTSHGINSGSLGDSIEFLGCWSASDGRLVIPGFR